MFMLMKIISSCARLFFFGAFFAALAACSDDNASNESSASALRLVSSNIEDGAVVSSRKGTLELTFDRDIKQAPDKALLFNGLPATVTIDGKMLRYEYSLAEYGTDCTFRIPARSLTDLDGNPHDESFTLRFSVNETVTARLFDAVVDLNGKGTHTSVQAAIDDAPKNRTTPYLIFIANGTYEEFVNVPKDKPFLHFIGQDREKTVITRMLTSASNATGEGGEEAWTHSWRNSANTGYQEAVTMIYAPDCYAEGLSFENRWGVEKLIGPMAEAMYTANTRIAFRDCRFRSFQDTWQTAVTKAGATINAKQYASDCLIEGAVDYIYGDGNILIENSTFYNVRYGSVIAAAAHAEGTEWGYVFKGCVIDGVNKVNPSVYGTDKLDYINGKGWGQALGRPWKNAPITVFLNTTLKFDIDPRGWRDMSAYPKLFAEYKTIGKNGNPVDMSGRKTTFTAGEGEQAYTGKTELSAEEAARYTYENIITAGDGWDPKAFAEKAAAPANVKLEGNKLTWNAANRAICYLVFKEDGTFVAQTETNSLTVADADAKYTVRSANAYGSLSK